MSTNVRSLRQRMKSLLNEEETKDVTFLFYDDDQLTGTLSAHKIVLVSASPVFKAMFFGLMAEKGEVKIVDASLKAFKLMVQAIYTDECELHVDIVGEVLYLAEKYDIVQLMELCRSFIHANISKKTVVKLYKILNLLQQEDLCNKCLEVMDRNAHYIINSNEVVELLDKDLFRKLLARDTFCAREIDILDAVKWWASQQVGPESAAIRKYVSDLLPLIRFPLMTLKEFVTIAVPSNLLTPDEVLQLLACYNLKRETPQNLLYSAVPRTLKIEFSVKASEMPRELGGNQVHLRGHFERAVSKGLRSIKLKVHNRVFLKRVDLVNVPDRLGDGAFVTVIRVLDLDLNESVARHDFVLKRHNPSHLPPRSGRYDLELSEPVELCPKISYEIQVSVEGPKDAPTENVRVKLPEGLCDAFFLFDKYARIFDDEVQVAELLFMF